MPSGRVFEALADGNKKDIAKYFREVSDRLEALKDEQFQRGTPAGTRDALRKYVPEQFRRLAKEAEK